MPFKQDNYIFNGPFSVGQIANQIGAEIVVPKGMQGVEDLQLANLAPLGVATDGDLTFFDNVKYLEQFLATKATACICHPKYAERAPEGVVLLTHDDAYVAYARASQAFYSSKDEKTGVHPQTDIHPTAKIGDGCSIGAFTSIGENVVIADNTIIGRNVTIRSARIGESCVIHDGVRIGQEGFGFAMGKGGHVKVPQLGGVIIGDFVEIGANTCIDRGAGPNTVIGSGTKIDNQVQIGHNVEIGKHCVIVAQSGIAGSTKIDDYAILGGKAGISGHLKIGAGARIAANSGVIKDIPPHASVGGYPSMNIRDWHKSTLLIEKMVKEKKKKE